MAPKWWRNKSEGVDGFSPWYELMLSTLENCVSVKINQVGKDFKLSDS